MPVSVVCEAGSMSSGILESIPAFSNVLSRQNENQNIQNKLITTSKRVLSTKIEFEEVQNNQSFIDTFKSKYILLKPYSSSNGKCQSSDYDSAGSYSKSSINNSHGGGNNQARESTEFPNPKRILFSKENVQIGWKSSGRKWQVGAGMLNVGNTCYLNSTLQALFHVPAMANWLMSDSIHRTTCESENGAQGGCIICAMSKTLISSQTSPTAIRPFLVYSKLRMVCKHLIMGRQEDAHEFLRYLIEAMEKSYLSRFPNSKDLDQYSKETTPLNQILGGYLRSNVQCLACEHVSTTFQHFEDLLLDIRKALTLEEALESYFALERLEDMGYKCESCKKKVAATKRFSLERAPVSLCIQLKRFNVVGNKLNKHVAIRSRLDLTPYSSKQSTEPLIYKLVAMVTHIGSSQHGGHYTAIGITDSGNYYQFDDSCVRPISLQNVLNTNAYIIFYELDDSKNSSVTNTDNIENFDRSKENAIKLISLDNNKSKDERDIFGSLNNFSSNKNFDSKVIKVEPRNLNENKSTIINKQNDQNISENIKTNLSSSDYDAVQSNQVESTPKPTFNRIQFSGKAFKPYFDYSKKEARSTETESSLTDSTVNFTKTSGDDCVNIFSCNNTNNDKKYNKHENVSSSNTNGNESNQPSNSNSITKIFSNMLDAESQKGKKVVSKFQVQSTKTMDSSMGENSSSLKYPLLNSWSNPNQLRSLVPYESNGNSDDSIDMIDDDDDDDEDGGGVIDTKTIIADSTTERNPVNGYASENNYSSTSAEASPIVLRTPITSSPPVIKTKTGFWQVTNATKNYVSTTSCNNEKKIEKKPADSTQNHHTDPSGQLMKSSHLGYAAPILSWNDHKSKLEKEVEEKKRAEQKRDLSEKTEHTWMDHGKQKKIKRHSSGFRKNAGYNPLQEHQNQIIRWDNGNVNRRFHHSSNYRSNYQQYRSQNGFRYNRFQRRTHHVRSSENGPYHRDS